LAAPRICQGISGYILARVPELWLPLFPLDRMGSFAQKFGHFGGGFVILILEKIFQVKGKSPNDNNELRLWKHVHLVDPCVA